MSCPLGFEKCIECGYYDYMDDKCTRKNYKKIKETGEKK